MNENTLTENEEKMLVLRFLLLLQGQKIDASILGKDLGWPNKITADTLASLQAKSLVFKQHTSIELEWEGEETARKILMKRLFLTGTKSSWMTPSA